MKVAIRLPFLLLLCIAAVPPAHAGKNAGGTLIVHTNDAVYFRYPDQYCNPEFEPGACESAVTRTDHAENQASLVWFLAAFPQYSQPAVTSISFGVRHNLPIGQGYVFAWSACGALPFQDPEPGFPDTPGGDTMDFLDPVRDAFFPFSWFAAYGFPDAYFGSRPDPRLGVAQFVDDVLPPNVDQAEAFGEVRWYAEGTNECPTADVVVCCLPTGLCVVQPANVCVEEGGTVLPGYDACTPDLCGTNQFGACCLDDACRISQAEACEDAGGIFYGIGSTCDPNPCFSEFGACCDGDVCALKTRLQCEADGGEWLGYIPCDPVNPCPLAGACCMPDGSCTLSLEQDCVDSGGTWTDSGVPCLPNPCPTAVQPTTWGRVRATYR
ncbi:MAG: hypothetical protein QUU85_14760 [Candidatus Eisenbacteria bacterium]|nr:hypothetical protein [Candidatus Eisenbacteria bacterium]